jgi:hypothetical protein
MRPLSPTPSAETTNLTRREAIRRATLLLGVALSPSIVSAVLQGQTAGPAAGGKPVGLDARQLAVVAAMTERILPRTDTPGALDVGVPAFIDRMVGGYLTPEEKARFLAGLAGAAELCGATHRRDFPELAAAEQDALLRRLAEGGGALGAFFLQLRELTIVGYFTSETVGRTVLHYDPVPGPFRADVPLAKVGNRAWTR